MSQILHKPIIYACIPALNECQTLRNIILQTRKYVDEIFVCDDGSTDSTSELSISLGAHVIRHRKNMGKGASINSLLKAVEPLNPDIVVTLDGDGQHVPDEISKIIEPILNGEADFVIGSRFLNGSGTRLPLYRRFGLSIINGLSRYGVKDTQSGFRAFSRKGLEVVASAEMDGYGVETEQIFLAKKFNLKIVEVPVKMYYGGSLITSKKNPISHGFEIIYTMFCLSVKDRTLFILGVLASIVFGLSVISGYYLLLYNNINGYISIPLVLLFFINFTLGIIFSISSLFLQITQRLVRKISEIFNSSNPNEKKIEESV